MARVWYNIEANEKAFVTTCTPLIYLQEMEQVRDALNQEVLTREIFQDKVTLQLQPDTPY